MGYSDAEIAAGLRISVPTLRKHYFSELKRRSMQRTRLELWEAHKLAELANGGNVGAMKQLRKLIDKRDLELAARRAAERGSDQDEAEASTTSIGKKEAARRQAEEAVEGGSLWGADLTPGGYH
jgi:hypothetical protein